MICKNCGSANISIKQNDKIVSKPNNNTFGWKNIWTIVEKRIIYHCNDCNKDFTIK